MFSRCICSDIVCGCISLQQLELVEFVWREIEERWRGSFDDDDDEEEEEEEDDEDEDDDDEKLKRGGVSLTTLGQILAFQAFSTRGFIHAAAVAAAAEIS